MFGALPPAEARGPPPPRWFNMMRGRKYVRFKCSSRPTEIATYSYLSINHAQLGARNNRKPKGSGKIILMLEGGWDDAVKFPNTIPTYGFAVGEMLFAELTCRVAASCSGLAACMLVQIQCAISSLLYFTWLLLPVFGVCGTWGGLGPWV